MRKLNLSGGLSGAARRVAQGLRRAGGAVARVLGEMSPRRFIQDIRSGDPVTVRGRVALSTAVVSAVFCVAVIVLLLANLVEARSADPLQPARIEQLRAELARQPDNEQLRREIRALDLHVREEYFRTRARAVLGVYLLLAGALALLASLHVLAGCRAAMSQGTVRGSVAAWMDAAAARRSVLVLGLVLLGFMLTIGVLGRHDVSSEYVRAVESGQHEGQHEGVEVGALIAGEPIAPPALPGGTPESVPPLPEPPDDGLNDVPLPPLDDPFPPAPRPRRPRTPSAPSWPDLPDERDVPIPAPADDRPEPRPAPARNDAETRPAPAPAANDARRPPTPAPGPASAPAPAPPGLPGGPGLPGAPGLARAPAPAALPPVESWPGFRGPAGGMAVGGEFPVRWDAETGEGVVWTSEVALPGKSSPILVNGTAFVSGAEADKREVYAFEGESGKLLWRRAVEIAVSATDEPPRVLPDTGYAAPTMASDGKRVFALFANGDVAAFNLDGTPAWSKSLGAPENRYGHASSPAVFRNILIIQLDQGWEAEDGLSVLLALDVADGKTIWRTRRPVRDSWASPVVAEIGGRHQIITAAEPYVISYDPGTGKELWRTECLSGDVAPSPLVAGGKVFVAQTGAGLFAIEPPAPGAGTQGRIIWQAQDGLPDTVSPAGNGELVFLVTSGGLVTCYDAADGKKQWEHDLAAPVTASPVIVGENVYLADTTGVTHVFRAARTFKAVGSGKLGQALYATPAFAGGRIYLRGESRLVCVGER